MRNCDVDVAVTLRFYSAIRYVCTSSRPAGCGLVRLAAPDEEGADTDGLAAASFFLWSCGLSRESSTVASVQEEKTD